METRERRPDLEASEYKRPRSLTPLIFPMFPRAMTQGKLYYQQIWSDQSAQTGRSFGAAPTENTTISDINVAYDLDNDEFIHREKVPAEEIAGLGGLDAAQQQASRVGKRAVDTSIEKLTSANILGNGNVTYTDIGSSLLNAVSVGFDKLADYPGDGDIVLVISSKLFNLVKHFDNVVERMKFTGVLPASIRDVRGISKQQLAAALGVDDVLVGNNTEWYSAASAYQDRAALVKLPSVMGPNEEPQVGRTLWFSSNGDVPAQDAMFTVHSWYSKAKISEMVDVQAFAEQKVLNTDLIYGLDGVDATLWTS